VNARSPTLVYGIPYEEWVHLTVAERDARVPDWMNRESGWRTAPMPNAQMLDESEALQARSSAERSLALLRDLEIDADNMAMAGEILVDVKKKLRTLEDRLKEITAPMRAAEKSARDLFRPAISALEEAESLLKSKVAQAQRKQMEINRLAMEATQAALQSGDSRGAALAAAVIAPTAPPANVGTRDVWKFLVENPELVPRAFCSPDDGKIRAHIKIYGDKQPITGVNIFADVQVSVRTK